MTSLHKKFVLDEVFLMAWNASAQHNRLYALECTPTQRIVFKNRMKEFIESSVLPNYHHDYSEKDHLSFIHSIKEYAEKEFCPILSKGTYTIGTAQKLLNLLLKYYWCLGYLDNTPLHCPVDRIILQVAGINSVNWTDFDTADEYQGIVNRLKEVAQSRSLAEWELDLWSRRTTAT
ncbi:MAG: hypothetical protein GW949_09965 [Spirochaetales bacterium]|nr:hypothetical protein [Spirochaetales bacterium]